jgi:hypothetical protein
MPMRKSVTVCLTAAALGVMISGAAAQDADVAALVKKLNSTFEMAAGANGLGKLGAKAQSAIPDLGKALKKAGFQSDRVAIAQALEKIVSAVRRHPQPQVAGENGRHRRRAGRPRQGA